MRTRTSERRHEHVAFVHGCDFGAISSRRAVARGRARDSAQVTPGSEVRARGTSNMTSSCFSLAHVQLACRTQKGNP